MSLRLQRAPGLEAFELAGLPMQRVIVQLHLLRAHPLLPQKGSHFADAGYQGPRVASAVALTGRWIVERTLAWISRNRRLARDFERYPSTVAAFVRLAMICIALQRLAAKTSA